MMVQQGAGIDPQQLQQALAQLHDIAEPAAPGWWPLAPGWWALSACVVLAVLGLAGAYYWWRKTALRRAAAQHLRNLEQASATTDDLEFLSNLADLLRRASRQRYPQSVALTGQAWAEHLNQVGQTDFFTSEAGKKLLESRFSGAVSVAREPYITAVAMWLQKAL
jgi:hypothetical protein